MRKDQLEILDSVQKLTIHQFYLLETPKTPQQHFLHLFAHRILIKKGMFNKNLDRIRPLLPGSFANSSLNNQLLRLYIENNVDIDEEGAIIELVHAWVNIYPTIKSTKQKYILADLVLQEGVELESIDGFYNYLSYLNIISVDLWKIIRNKKKQADFYVERPAKQQIKQILSDKIGAKLDANDLLAFVSGCIPKVLLNIILQKEGLPSQLKRANKKLQCLYSNQSIQYFLKTQVKLSLLLRQIILILTTLDLTTVQQKFLMLVAIRYFYVYHFDRKYSASEIFIYCFNKLSDDVRKSLNDEFALFFKIILKLGKNKFCNFISQNSPFGKAIIDLVKNKPIIGYPQQSANPYNTLGISETISIERGATAFRYFQILEDFSIFYFRIQPANLDITIKLYYLGEVTSSKAIKTLLFTHEKSTGQLKNSVNAMKRGLYMFEFDNSYSWINGKKILYENQVYTPLELKTVNADLWIDDFYENIYMNQIANQGEIIQVQYKKPEEKIETTATVSLDKAGGLFSLRVTKKGEGYVYETDNVQRMLQKVNQYASSKENYAWIIGERNIEDKGEIEGYLRGSQSSERRKEERKPQKRQQKQPQKIQLGEFKQDDQQDTEYEVVSREVQKSQIITQSLKGSSSKKIESEKVEESKAQLISSNYEEQASDV